LRLQLCVSLAVCVVHVSGLLVFMRYGNGRQAPQRSWRLCWCSGHVPRRSERSRARQGRRESDRAVSCRLVSLGAVSCVVSIISVYRFSVELAHDLELFEHASIA
jgi:hypothetical protein